MKWHNVDDGYPIRNKRWDHGWRLCDFGGNIYFSARWISEERKWQLANYQWANMVPLRYCNLPNRKSK